MSATFDFRGITTDGPPWSSESRKDSPAPSFTPLVVDDLSSYTLGQAYPGWKPGSSIIDDAPGSLRAIQVELNTNTPPACGGSVDFGGRMALPQVIPIGKTVWFSHKRYLPSAMTWGYCYANADFDEAVGCGKDDNSDGNAWLKDVVFAPTTGTSRIYFQPSVRRRQVSLTAGCRLISENGSLLNDEESPIYPLDEWFTLQVMVRVGSDGTGLMRAWINGTLVNEVAGANVSSGNSLAEFGIGDYWNGVPYTDGESGREIFYLRDFIVASDIDGYEAPTGTDSLGNVFIDPSTTAAELS